MAKDTSERADTLCTCVYNEKDNESLHKSLNSEFTLYQSLLNQLLNKDGIEPSAKDGIYKYFKPDEKVDKKVMKEFDRTYRWSDAIHWYTKETCIYRILNKALRTQKLDDITAFAPFIRDLFKQLGEEHVPFIKKRPQSKFHVYRGQLISKDELTRLRFGDNQRISVNSFLSTSTNREKAIEFATSRPPPSDTLTSILLEIEIDPKIYDRPFADIKHLSAIPSEEEILFVFGCIFRITKISQDEKLKLWRANMSLCVAEDDVYKEFSSPKSKESFGISFGMNLLDMNKFEQAKGYFHNLIKTKPTMKVIDLASCYYGLAQVMNKEGDSGGALQHLQFALDQLENNVDTKHDSLIGKCYNDQGLIYCAMGEFLRAMTSYDKALSTENNDDSTSYARLAALQFRLKNYRLALDYQNKVSDKMSETKKSSDVEHFIQLANIYAAMNDHDKSNKAFEDAIAIQKEKLPPGHPDLGYTYNSQAQLIYASGQTKKATELFQQSLDLQSASLSSAHPDFAATYQHLGKISWDQKEFDSALNYYQKVLENQLKIFSINHPSVGETLKNLAKINYEKTDFDEAIVFYRKFLHNQLARLPAGSPELDATYRIIADIYRDKKNNHDQALKYYLRLLKNQLERVEQTDPSLVELYETIGKIYYEKHQYPLALVHFNRAVDSASRQKLINQSVIARLYHWVGKIYLKKKHNEPTFLSHEDTVANLPHQSSRTQLDNFHGEKNHMDQALSYFHRLLQGQQAIEETSSFSNREIYRILANINAEKRDWNEASNYFQEFLKIQYSHNDPWVADTFAHLGEIHQKRGQMDQALIHYQNALSIYQRILGPSSIIVQQLEEKSRRLSSVR